MQDKPVNQSKTEESAVLKSVHSKIFRRQILIIISYQFKNSFQFYSKGIKKFRIKTVQILYIFKQRNVQKFNELICSYSCINPLTLLLMADIIVPMGSILMD